MLEDQYLSSETAEVQRAYVEGFIYGVEIAGGGNCSYIGDEQRKAYVRGRIAVYEETAHKYVRMGARKLISQRQFDEAKVRGMLFDVSQLTDELAGYDQSGNATFALSKAAPYPDYVMRNTQTGAEVTPEKYAAMSADEQAMFRKVRYFKAGYARVYEDDDTFVAEFIVQDFLRHPGLKTFYDQELTPGGRLERYKGAVETAKRDYGWDISELEHRLANRNTATT